MADNPYLRGLRRLAAAAGTVVLSAGVITAGTAPASADEPVRLKAVCEYRLCLLVLDKSADKDGDGVTDVDEEALGSDPDDPTSRPETEKIFNVALARELPSFEQHLTELVALPRNNRENTGLSTGLGTIPFPERGPLIKSVDGLVDTLKTNGYKGFGTNMTVTLTQRPKFSEPELLKFAALGNVALHGSKTDRGLKLAGILGVTSFGANGDRTPTGFTDHGFSYGEGRASFGRQYMVGYGEGMWDDVSTSMSHAADLTVTDSTVTSYKGSRASGHTSVTSESRHSAESDGFSMEIFKIVVETKGYDEDGNPLGGSTTHHNSSSTNYPDGSSTWYAESTTIHRDKDGNVTGTETSGGKGTTDTDGKSKSETWDTKCDGAGNCEEPKHTCEGAGCDDSGGSGGDEPGDGGDPCEGEDCPPAGNETEGMPNPYSTGIGVVTAADWARVEAFLNSTRTPDRNSDEPEIPDTPPNTGPYDPMVAMVDPDGVFTLSVTTTPDFNRAQPNYGPTLNGIIGIAGIEPPVRQEPDPVSWP